LEKERERIERRGSVGEKGKGRGYGQNALLLPPLPPDPEQRRAGAASADGGNGAQGSAAAGGKGKMEGESRGSQPCAYLGPGSLVEAAPRRWAAMVVGGGGAGRLGR
jgi:hypothetical protein